LLAPPPATPGGTIPVSVQQGVTTNVVLTGTVVGGSGFFDPGAGFTNHISAAVNGGGVTVNSVTFTDPTHITLNLTVAAGAAAGARSITVTNPDGQAVTSGSGILTVAAAAGTISGTVYQDNNGNATLDAGESGMSGVVVFL